MAEKHFDAEDPLEFVAHGFPVEDGVDQDAVTARCFVEEFALMGKSPRAVKALFTSDHFVGTHDILARRGAEFVDRIIEDVFGEPAPAPPTRVPVRVRPTHKGGGRRG